MKIKFYHIVAVWIVYTFVMTTIMYFVHPPYMTEYTFFNELRWELAFSLCWIAATPIVLSFSRRYSFFGNQKLKNSVILIFFGILFALILCVGHALVVYCLHMGAKELNQAHFKTSLFVNIDKMIIVYFVIVLLQHVSMYSLQVQEKEIRESQLQTQLAQAQMQALKMQLQPHFLFNTLNAIVSLIQKDPDLAEEMIVRLSNFLRLTLDASGKQLISLQEELSFVQAYLDIEKIRFEEKFQFHEHIPNELLNAEVPILLLQPLVENAMKHAISRYSSADVLEIDAERKNGNLILTIKDNGIPFNEYNGKEQKEGIGLTNTRNRLEALYSGRFSLSISPNVPNGFIVTITIPFSLIQNDDECSDR
jgi:two-component system, LytTR family, sensor kinase